MEIELERGGIVLRQLDESLLRFLPFSRQCLLEEGDRVVIKNSWMSNVSCLSP
jgi:hypothetical protein